MPFPNFANQLYVGSLLVQIPSQSTSAVGDIAFDFGTKPSGAVIILEDCQYGDTGKIEIIHPQAGVIGELGNVHLPPGKREVNIIVEDPNTDVPVGLSYRFTLSASDSNGRNVIIWLLVKR